MAKFLVVPDSSGGGGNTKSPSPAKTKQISPALRWGFVLNNYTEDDINSIVPKFQENCKIACFSKEICPTTGTPHLQGYLEFHKKKRPLSLQLTKRIHWGDKYGKPAVGTRQENIDYCEKWGEQELAWTHGFPKKVKIIDPTYEWEQEILKIIKEEPDDRTVHWYYGDGNIGKTSFCKYLGIKHGALITGGKASDMKHAICQFHESEGDYPTLLVMNIPKSYDKTYLNYDGIESCKDMLFRSGKYEGKSVIGNCPHLFVFANEEPDYSKMMGARWVVTNIGAGGKILPKYDEEDYGEFA